MRPLIEILEDERRIMQRLENIYRYLLRDDDPEMIELLYAKKVKFEHDLGLVRVELKEYIEKIFCKDS